MVNIKLQYDEQEKQFDINVKLNIQISDPYVRVNNNIISSETTLNSVIRKIDILDKIRPGRFQQLSNKALIEQLTMEKVNVGDIIFCPTTKCMWRKQSTLILQSILTCTR